jgi:hypothetical protein
MDPGSSDFLRSLWNLEELPTDETICAWGSNDQVADINNMSWSSLNQWPYILYDRSMYAITIATSFLQNTASAPSSFSQTQLDSLKTYRAEARFVRAFQYWALMDVFGSPAFIDDNSPIGTKFMPQQISRDSLFGFIESELMAIQPDLAAPHTNEYGRADQAADWALLARMYLNAQVYTGTARWTDAITYASKVIGAGYSLMPQYNRLFMADNDQNNPEVIFPIPYDANNGQTYGGTTFLVQSMIDSKTPQSVMATMGVPGSSGWGGNRARRQFPYFFTGTDNNNTDFTGVGDARAALLTVSTNTGAYSNNDAYLIDAASSFEQGVETPKYRNMNSDGSLPTGAGTFCSIDFPLFRLAEMYLIYAEAVKNGGSGGDQNTATSYINALRTRAKATTVTWSQIAGNDANSGLPFILAERSRELYLESFRRTDLIRFNDFTTSNYIWDWKGGTQNGSSVDNHYNLYPLPANEMTVNTNLKQNAGY